VLGSALFRALIATAAIGPPSHLECAPRIGEGAAVRVPKGDDGDDRSGGDADADVAALVRAARAGDRAAFAALYRRFARAVHAVVLARASYGDAGDLVQDVFVVALERLEQVADPAAFPGWILSVARSRAIDHVRKQRPVELVGEPAATPAPTAEAQRALDAIRALPEAYRETLIMRFVEGMTGPEIAERTGLAPGSVRVNLHRGMKLLRDKLEADRG